MKALIIEDELPAARRLIRLIGEVAPEISVIGQLDSVESAISWFRTNPMPDLVFLDIHLSDGYSFSIFKEIDITAPIIFTTAFDEYALEAFKVNSIDYLLKPVEVENLQKSIIKLKNLQGGKITELMKNIDSILHESRHLSKYKTRYLIRQKNQLLRVEEKQVAYFLAHDKIVALVTFENRQFIMDENLGWYESQVDPDKFYRLNRSVLASRESIIKIFTHFNGKLKVELIPPLKEDVFVSRDKAESFRMWLED